MVAEGFWANFWPNFAATAIAVVAGIPTGLWINRQAERRAAESRAKEAETSELRRLHEEIVRTREALEQLEPVIRSHQGWFAILGAWGNLNEYHVGPLIEPWVALRTQIAPERLTDRKLLGDLAAHFERCVRLDELVRVRSGLTITGPPAQHERMLIDERAIKTVLNNITNAEGAAPDRLAIRVVEEIERLRGQANLGGES